MNLFNFNDRSSGSSLDVCFFLDILLLFSFILLVNSRMKIRWLNIIIIIGGGSVSLLRLWRNFLGPFLRLLVNLHRFLLLSTLSRWGCFCDRCLFII